MSADEDGVVATIATTIRGYFATHPAAADSVEGIQRWWLLPLLREEPLPLVEIALERLVVDGTARRVVLEDGRVVYAYLRRND